MILKEETNKIVCHSEKMYGFGMLYHIERIGIYLCDGSVFRPENNPDKYSYIQYPELRKWNRGDGVKAEEAEAEWEKAVSSLERRPQPGKLQEDREDIGFKKGDVVLTRTVEFIISAGKIFWRKLRENYPVDEDFYAQCEKYFKDARRAIKELYPDSIFFKWATNYEEESPHMHLHVLPILRSPKRCKKEELEDKSKMRALGEKITEAKNNEDEETEKIARQALLKLQKEIKDRNEKKEKILRYSASEFFGGPEGGVRLQNKMAEVLCKNWNVQRADYNSDARNIKYIQLKKILLETQKQQQVERENILQDKEEIGREKEELERQNEKIAKMMEERKNESDLIIKKAEEKARKIKENAWKVASDIDRSSKETAYDNIKKSENFIEFLMKKIFKLEGGKNVYNWAKDFINSIIPKDKQVNKKNTNQKQDDNKARS